MTDQRHVAVLPFPFTSHPASELTLVCRLARAAPEVHFSFFNTSNSNANLLNRDGDHTSLDNVKLYDVEDGVPPGHVVSGKDPEAPDLFLKASPENFKKAMTVAVAETGRKITCLLVDAFLSAVSANLAEELRVPWIAIWSGSPCSLSAFVHVDLIRKRFHAMKKLHNGFVEEDLPLDFVPGLSGMRVSDHCPQEIITGDDLGGSLILQAFCGLGQVLPRAAAVVVNSYGKLNLNDLNLDLESKLQSLFNLGFFTTSVPPLPLPPSDSDPTGCLSWLDNQQPNSVAYICFGTFASLSEKELTATAEALEGSQLPFIWSLPDHLKRLLPNGFVNNNHKKGKIVSWANQVEVLGHDSTGVHVTHCGTNSVNESIANGVPMICRPFWADNFMNAKMVENVWGIGVGVEGRIITKNGLVKALELVLGGEEGKNMRERACALKEATWEGSSPSGSATQDFKALLGLITSAGTDNGEKKF